MSNFHTSQDTKAYDDAHKNSDTDNEASSIHHSLGGSPVQAAPGNHDHDSDYSPVGHNHDTSYPLRTETRYWIGPATTSVNATTAVQFIPGMSVTVPSNGPSDVFLANWTCDIGTTTTPTGIAVVGLYVDGALYTGIQALFQATAHTQRNTVSQQINVTGLAPGNHTFTAFVQTTAGATYIARQPHSVLSVLKVYG